MRIDVGDFDALQVDNVYLDGSLVEHVTSLNVGEGWVIRYVTDHNGDFVAENDFLVSEILHGSVTIDQKKN